MKKIILTSLVTLLIIAGAMAQSSNPISSDKKEDMKDLRNDIRDKNNDKRKLHHERKEGDKKETKRIQRDLVADRKDIREDKRDLKKTKRRRGKDQAAAIIAVKSAAFRLAPPTNAPSTSGCESNSLALSAFTEPPY